MLSPHFTPVCLTYWISLTILEYSALLKRLFLILGLIFRFITLLIQPFLLMLLVKLKALYILPRHYLCWPAFSKQFQSFIFSIVLL